jgi:hypothetical protein
MRLIHKEKSSNPKNIQSIEKQLEIITKTINHTSFYKDKFLYKIQSQFLTKITNTTKANVYRYAFQNSKEMNSI